MKKLCLFLFLFMPLVANAQFLKAKVGSLWYSIFRDKTCWVDYGPNDELEYSGDIFIPSTIEYREDTYEVTRISFLCFAGNKEITSVVISEGVKEIGPSSFVRCDKLKSIILPNSVTIIDRMAFEDCKNLEEITISESVTNIKENAFNGCESLKKVTCHATTVPETSSSFFDYAKSATLYVPAESIEAYRKTAPWNTFKNILPIPKE